MEFEEGKYGMLMMGLCDREGRVYDVWITLADYLEKILGKRVDLLTPNALKQVPEVLEGKWDGLVGIEEKEDSSERQWVGSGV